MEEHFRNTELARLKVTEQPLEETYDGAVGLRYLPSPGRWESAFVRYPDKGTEKTGECIHERQI